MTACVDGFRLRLTTDTAVTAVPIAGAGGGAFVVQHPCVAAAVRAGAGTVSASAVALVGVCSKILNVVAGITFVVICVAARRMRDFHVGALKRVFAAGRAVADDRTSGLH